MLTFQSLRVRLLEISEVFLNALTFLSKFEKRIFSNYFSDINRHETFQIFGRFQIFSFQIIISKSVGFDLKVSKTQFWTGGVGDSDFLWLVSDFFMQSSVSCLY